MNEQCLHLEVDGRTGGVRLVYATPRGGVPEEVWYRHCLRWPVGEIRESGVDHLLQVVEPLAQRITRGHDTTWDDVRARYVATYTSDADEAALLVERAIQQVVEDPEYQRHAVDAWSWLSLTAGSPSTDDLMRDAEEWGITAETTDDDLAVIGERIKAQQKLEHGIDELCGLADYLRALRGSLRTSKAWS